MEWAGIDTASFKMTAHACSNPCAARAKGGEGTGVAVFGGDFRTECRAGWHNHNAFDLDVMNTPKTLLFVSGTYDAEQRPGWILTSLARRD
jgi:hypothetical protein